VIFGAMAVGQNSTFAPDYAEAKVSAQRMFALFDKKPSIDAYSKDGLSPVRYINNLRPIINFYWREKIVLMRIH